MQQQKSKIIWVIVLCLFVSAGSILLYNLLYPRKIVASAPIKDYVPIIRYIDKGGITRSEFEALELSNQQLKAETKTLRKQLKGNHKIESVTNYTIAIDTTLKDIPSTKDSLKEEYKIEHEDNYLKLFATINTRTETGQLGFELTDTITDIRSRKKGFISFGRGKQTVTLSSKGGYINFFEGNSITTKDKRNILTLSAGVSYNPFTNKVFPSIHIGVPLITIKSNK